jgi:hypothetical protein
MSSPERIAIVLGLFLGARELHESGMIHPEPAPGPLTGIPFGPAVPTVTHAGSIQIAERLGLFKWHPLISVPDKGTPGRKKSIAFPLLHDLVWYFDDGQPYALNWTVKARPEDFERPFEGSHLRRRPTVQDIEKARARVAIEEAVFREVNVRTVRVAASDIPKQVWFNLKSAYMAHALQPDLDPALQEDYLDTLRARMHAGVPAFETLIYFLNRWGGTFEDYRALLYRAVWERKLDVDLWTPINIDQPLKPAQRSVSQHFATWTSR